MLECPSLTLPLHLRDIFIWMVPMTLDTPTEMSPAARRLERKITELHKKKYLPQELVMLMAEVSRIQLAAEQGITFVAGKPNTLPEGLSLSTPERHAQGEPVLVRELFPLDKESLPRIAENIFAILGNISPHLHEFGEALRQAFTEKTYSLEEACRAIVAEPVSLDENSYFYDWAQKYPQAPFFFSFIAASCVLPSVKVAGKLLAEHHKSETVWTHGHCPLCGSLPLMGRLVDTAGFRMHTCSFCLHEYKAPRLSCPFCLHSSGDKDNYFSSEDEPGYQLQVCHECESYCKVADFREFDRVYIPVLDDLGSLILDMYGRKEGYMRPTLSAWGV